MLSESMGEMTQLTSLDLAWGQLSTIPSELQYLTNLQYLGLAGNPLTSQAKSWLANVFDQSVLDL